MFAVILGVQHGKEYSPRSCCFVGVLNCPIILSMLDYFLCSQIRLQHRFDEILYRDQLYFSTAPSYEPPVSTNFSQLNDCL